MARVKSEVEAALGGEARPVFVEDLAYVQYGLDGMLDIGGKIPPHQVPATLRNMADKLETLPRYQAPEATE